MKERPILFSAPMVQAILAGNKTQTRRVVKNLHPDCHQSFLRKEDGLLGWRDKFGRFMQAFPCPYGQVGDQLWVREAWAKCFVAQAGQEWFVYRACDNSTDYGGPWKPSIHMPRKASRIQLEITNIRVERLQDISEADALAEGVFCNSAGASEEFTHGALFRDLWQSINGEESWNANPWVWVVEFRRLKP